MMLLNVWGVVWRVQKRLIAWTKPNSENGTPMPERAPRMAFLASRINACAWLSIPLLFLMGTASHYPMFGRKKKSSSQHNFWPKRLGNAR